MRIGRIYMSALLLLMLSVDPYSTTPPLNSSVFGIERLEGQSSHTLQDEEDRDRNADSNPRSPEGTHAELKSWPMRSSRMHYSSSSSSSAVTGIRVAPSARQMMGGMTGLLPTIGALIAIGKVIGIKVGIVKKAVAGGDQNMGPTIITRVLPPGEVAAGGFRYPETFSSPRVVQPASYPPVDPDVVRVQPRYRVAGSSQSLHKVDFEDSVIMLNETSLEIHS